MQGEKCHRQPGGSTGKTGFAPAIRIARGPARRALVRCGLRVNEKQRVLVDMAQEFAAAQWNDARRFIALP
jgi:hypothetical protein